MTGIFGCRAQWVGFLRIIRASKPLMGGITPIARLFWRLFSQKIDRIDEINEGRA